MSALDTIKEIRRMTVRPGLSKETIELLETKIELLTEQVIALETNKTTRRNRRPAQKVNKEIIIAIITALITAVTTIITTWITQIAPRDKEIKQVEQEKHELKLPPRTTQDDPGAPPFFQVLGVRHKDGSIGKYFGFDAADLDKILGPQGWKDDKTILVSPTENGPFRPAKVWKSSNGTAGTAHGRYDKGEKEGDWHTGQKIYVQPEKR
jgi:hypothetical protein